MHAELPGVKKEDIHVTIDGNLVSISAEVKQEGSEGRRTGPPFERYFGRSRVPFQLAQDIDDGKAVAKFNEGVLERTLPNGRPPPASGWRLTDARGKTRPPDRRWRRARFRAGDRPAQP